MRCSDDEQCSKSNVPETIFKTWAEQTHTSKMIGNEQVPWRSEHSFLTGHIRRVLHYLRLVHKQLRHHAPEISFPKRVMFWF